MDYCTCVHLYASYLEERLDCFSILKYDVQKDHLVAGKIAKLYAAITNGIVNLVNNAGLGFLCAQ
ncbi:hypothetical protein RchiOBHm_Chr5g0036501 [Rosa chinensis]|uniref:Uncharacterized protein n=1 Tax=Rosa chinensis TaxID=74649 RepID=A0A2P6QBH6_ROSCH|nr:hypothetical protein RchiOBHm_Chr5g0036501 [Rosa chinensis]